VAVSIASVVTAAQEATTRPLRAVLVDLGKHYAWFIELYLRPVGVDQHINRAHGEAFLSWLATLASIPIYFSPNYQRRS
jgi:hypothetical protein